MLLERVISFLESDLLKRPLSPPEHWVFSQSWAQKSYVYMASTSSYSVGYLKIIGSQLWHDLSAVLGVQVTKKNLFWVLTSQDSLRALCEQAELQGAGEWDFSSSHQLFQKTKSQSPTQSLDTPTTVAAAQPMTEVAYPDGPVPLDSPFYITRSPLEEQAFQELQQPGALLRVRGPVKTGKTSLMIRLLDQAQKLNYRLLVIDFQLLNRDCLETSDRFFRWLCASIGSQLNASLRVDDIWDDDLSANVICTTFLEAVALTAPSRPIVLAFNEVNRLFGNAQVTRDFLSLLRFWYEQAKQHERWQALRQLLVHSTEVYVPMRLDRSPFNVGLSLRLPPFTLTQVQKLAICHRLNWAEGESGLAELKPLWHLTGGNPHLLRIAFYHIRRSQLSLAQCLEQAQAPDGFYQDHLQEYHGLLHRQPHLAAALALVLQGESGEAETRFNPLEQQAVYHLESAGLVRFEGQRLVPSCELYRIHFWRSSVEAQVS